MLQNDSYVAVAYDDLVDQFKSSGAAAAAYRGEPFASGSFSGHLADQVNAYADAIGRRDYQAAEAIKGGLSNTLATGIQPSIAQTQQAIVDNRNSSARRGLENQLDQLNESKRGTIKSLMDLDAIDKGRWSGTPSVSTGAASPKAGVIDNIGSTIGGLLAGLVDTIGGMLGGIADAIGSALGAIGDALGGRLATDGRASDKTIGRSNHAEFSKKQNVALEELETIRGDWPWDKSELDDPLS